MRLSAHFTLEEFTKSSHAIPNNPNGVQVDNLASLCANILEPLRAHYGKPIKILSGFRSHDLNVIVGGSPTSQHTTGEASDIEIESIRNDDIWQYIVDALPFDQVIAEKLKKDDGSAGWVHVSHKLSGVQRGDAISFLGDGKYVKGLFYV